MWFILDKFPRTEAWEEYSSQATTTCLAHTTSNAWTLPHPLFLFYRAAQNGTPCFLFFLLWGVFLVLPLAIWFPKFSASGFLQGFACQAIYLSAPTFPGSVPCFTLNFDPISGSHCTRRPHCSGCLYLHAINLAQLQIHRSAPFPFFMDWSLISLRQIFWLPLTPTMPITVCIDWH